MNNAAMRMRAVFVLVAVPFLFSLLPLSAAEEYGKDNDDTPRVLVAYERSAFKNKVLNGIIEGLEDSAYLRVVDHNRGELSAEQSGEYDAVIIINAGVNSRVRPRVSAWLAEVEDTERVILLTTYRDRGWSPRYPEGIDSITSPSQTRVVADLVDTIGEKVQKLISTDTLLR